MNKIQKTIKTKIPASKKVVWAKTTTKIQLKGTDMPKKTKHSRYTAKKSNKA